MLKSIKVVVTGRVQGVCYRVSTQRIARQLGLKGWVKNRSDGDVEALICGEKSNVDELQRWMRLGPEGAQVDALQVCEVDWQESGDFSIQR